ncbi:MAG: polymer-forming cytoskeletal protein [Ignavibacteriales bacterium]|nr:polymer-forming cytoskeletal protein [Ignavibacteriales bacterium]MCB9217842.1 polymer-forming cytoskeletal protein [Ignavibacteriales bacterium]
MSKKENGYSEDVSILSDGVNIEGKISSNGNVRIDGKIIGDVNVKGNLTLGNSSEVNGKISAKNMTVSGKVEGTLKIEEKLTLETSARIKGDIIAKVLVIEEGAKFDGKSSMTQSTPYTGSTTSETK